MEEHGKSNDQDEIETLKHAFSCHKPQVTSVKKPANAAVLIPLIELPDGLHVVFEVRGQNVSQPGDVSFPGGHVEQGESFQQAAIRETCEELGISEDYITVLGPCDMLYTSSGCEVRSFAGVLSTNCSLNDFDHDEVAEVFTVPLEFFLHTEAATYQVELRESPVEPFPYHLIAGGRNYQWHHSTRTILFYQFEDRIIWGLTADLVHRFASIINNSSC